jgi:hypothetical protein
VAGSTVPAPIVYVAGTRAFAGTWLEDDVVVRAAEADRRLVAVLVAVEALPEMLTLAPVDVADVVDVVDVVAAAVAVCLELPHAATNSAIGSAKRRRRTRLTFPA